MIGTLPAGLLTGMRFPLSNAVIFRSACRSDPRLGFLPALRSASTNSSPHSQPTRVKKSGVNPGETFWTQRVERGDRRDLGCVLAQVQRGWLLQVGPVDRMGPAGVADELRVVGGGAQHHHRMEVLLAEVSEDGRRVVLGLLLEEEDLHSRVLHGHHLRREVRRRRRQRRVVEHRVAQVLHGLLLVAPGQLRRRQVGDDRGRVGDLRRVLLLEVEERTRRPSVRGGGRAEVVRQLLRVPGRATRSRRGTRGWLRSSGSLKLSSSDSPPTLAKSDWMTLWTSCLLSAPWNWSSALDTTILRPLTPPCEFT